MKKKMLTKKEWEKGIKPFVNSMGGFNFENDYLRIYKSSYRDFATVELIGNEDEDSFEVDEKNYDWLIEKLNEHLRIKKIVEFYTQIK